MRRSEHSMRRVVRGWLSTWAVGAALAFATFAVPARGAAQHGTPSGHGDVKGEGGEHGAGARGGGEHGAAGEHAVHDPEPFNFANLERYQKEKEGVSKAEKDAHGNAVTPVTPYLYVLVNALILFAIYYYAGKKPISDGLASRRNLIAKELDEASKVKAEAQARLTEYTQRLERLDEELGRLRAELTATGEAERARIVKEAEDKAERMRRDAYFLLEQELKQLRIDLLRSTIDAATVAAEAVLRNRLSPQDHERLADEYLAQVTALPAAGALGTGNATKGSAS